MDTIHVVYGPANASKTARAHNLAVARRNVFVHEIDGDQDVRLILASGYRHCIAILDAGDEPHARSTLHDLASRAKVELCAVTYEAAASAA